MPRKILRVSGWWWKGHRTALRWRLRDGEKSRGSRRKRNPLFSLALTSPSWKDLCETSRCLALTRNPSQAPEPETSPCPHQRCKKLNTQLEIFGTSETLLSPTPCAVHFVDGDTEGRGRAGTAQSRP